MNKKQKDSPGEATPPGKESFTVPAPVITLPKGGDAVRGIGEKFAANPVTGTGSMNVRYCHQPRPLGLRCFVLTGGSA